MSSSTLPAPNNLSVSMNSMNRSLSGEGLSSSSPVPPVRFKFNEIAKLINQELETTPIRRYVKVFYIFYVFEKT